MGAAAWQASCSFLPPSSTVGRNARRLETLGSFSLRRFALCPRIVNCLTCLPLPPSSPASPSSLSLPILLVQVHYALALRCLDAVPCFQLVLHSRHSLTHSFIIIIFQLLHIVAHRRFSFRSLFRIIARFRQHAHHNTTPHSLWTIFDWTLKLPH